MKFTPFPMMSVLMWLSSASYSLFLLDINYVGVELRELARRYPITLPPALCRCPRNPLPQHHARQIHTLGRRYWRVFPRSRRGQETFPCHISLPHQRVNLTTLSLSSATTLPGPSISVKEEITSGDFIINLHTKGIHKVTDQEDATARK